MGKLNDILKLSVDKLEPVYIISSEDRYILSEFKNKFAKKFVDESIKDFNYTFLEAGDDFPAVLKNQANTPPIMSEKRFIIVRSETYFVNKQKNEELILALFNNFPDTTILIILVDGKLNNKLKLVKEAKNLVKVINATSPKFAQLDKWIEKEFRKRGKIIDRIGINFLEQMFSNDLQRLESEIEKISLYRIEEERIGLEDILEIVSKDRLIEDNLVFSLTDAIMSRDNGKALTLLSQMIYGGAIPLVLLGTMVWQIKLLLSVKVLKEEGKNIQNISKILKSHQYPVKKCYKYSSNFTEKELEDMMERFLEANNNIVTGKYSPEMALEMAIIN
ncbi:MAG: DNA polymerase III subunit delta [Halanaerobiaceae bacterium]